MPKGDKFDEWVEAVYAKVIDDAGVDGMKREDAIPLVVDQVAADIAAGLIEVPLDIERLVRRTIEREDDRRRARQGKDVDYVLDVINGNTILGQDNPWLDTVCVIGDGQRKAWRYVDVDDLLAMAETKLQKAAEAAAAANDFLSKARTVTGYLLRTHGASAVIGDLS